MSIFRVALQISIGLATVIATSTIVATMPAQAGMDSNYVGGSIGTTSTAGFGDVVVGIDGRLKVTGTPLSARATVYPFDGGGVQLTGTLDVPLGEKTGAYIGGGVFLDNANSPVVQAGLETKLGKNTVLYGGVDYFTRFDTVLGKVGVGFSF
jgi:hypothetical protein